MLVQSAIHRRRDSTTVCRTDAESEMFSKQINRRECDVRIFFRSQQELAWRVMTLSTTVCRVTEDSLTLKSRPCDEEDKMSTKNRRVNADCLSFRTRAIIPTLCRILLWRETFCLMKESKRVFGVSYNVKMTYR